jgi:hypothetical protein
MRELFEVEGLIELGADAGRRPDVRVAGAEHHLLRYAARCRMDDRILVLGPAGLQAGKAP